MTITIDLSPSEEGALRARAEAVGTSVEAIIHQALAESGALDTAAPEENQAAIALFESWLAERDTASPEELARRDAELEEFKANINQWRAEEGRPPAYP